MKPINIVINFDLDRETDKKIYNGLINLPQHFGGDLSAAFIKFIDSMMHSLSECEEKKERCEILLLQITSKIGTAKVGHV
jgi:hypothetical protein